MSACAPATNVGSGVVVATEVLPVGEAKVVTEHCTAWMAPRTLSSLRLIAATGQLLGRLAQFALPRALRRSATLYSQIQAAHLRLGRLTRYPIFQVDMAGRSARTGRDHVHGRCDRLLHEVR